MKLYFGRRRDQLASLIGELPLMPGTGIMPILPWFFAFLFSGFFIPWRSRRLKKRLMQHNEAARRDS